MSHFIELCKICGDVISQCRCPDPDKEKRYGVCAKCTSKQSAQSDAPITVAYCDHAVQANGLCKCGAFRARR